MNWINSYKSNNSIPITIGTLIKKYKLNENIRSSQIENPTLFESSIYEQEASIMFRDLENE